MERPESGMPDDPEELRYGGPMEPGPRQRRSRNDQIRIGEAMSRLTTDGERWVDVAVERTAKTRLSSYVKQYRLDYVVDELLDYVHNRVARFVASEQVLADRHGRSLEPEQWIRIQL